MLTGREDPLHDISSDDIVSNQPTTYGFWEQESVHLNNENEDTRYDHLYYARLLGEQCAERRTAKNVQSECILEGLHKTETLMAVPTNKSQTRKRCRSPQNWRETPWVESKSTLILLSKCY